MRVIRGNAGSAAIIIVLVWAIIMLVMQRRRQCAESSGDSCVYGQTVHGTTNAGFQSHTTPVYVVEEHHEALLYWFDAANKGLIKRQGNVLFHIDGHSDGATPEDRTILPLFRWPSAHDIMNMMQRNDVFIVAAGFSGLIRRYIWVWSPWDVTPGEPALPDHMKVPVQLGTVAREGVDGRVFQDICMCTAASVFSDSKGQGLSGNICLMPNITHLYDDLPGVFVNPDRCDIHMNDGMIELVSEKKAIELMRSGSWITSRDSVILDIDEDYYGCEAAVQPLFDVNITESSMMWLQYFVGQTFCPSMTSQELQADKLYASIIDRIVHLKYFCVGRNDTLCKDMKELSTYIVRSVEEVYGNILERKLEKTFCGSDKNAKKLLGYILKRFLKFNIRQLRALREVGICLQGSTRTVSFAPKNGMRLCDGYNKPNESVVTFHTPTEAEVGFRTSQLTTILKTSGMHPGVVTVCRSMRDGYTPRKFFHRIEHDVLDVLTESFPRIDKTSIFYDSNLLGGVYGWPNRH